MPLDEIVRRAPFPLHGLGPDWAGEVGHRTVHSAGVAVGEVTHVALSHLVGTARLVVDTLFGEERAPADAPFHAALHLDLDAASSRWRPWTIAVDGEDHVFWRQDVAAAERWAAFARVGSVRVVVAATRWDPAGVRLTVVDREDYLVPAAATAETVSTWSTTSR